MSQTPDTSSVLVADDDELFAKLIEHTLVGEGYDVTCVSDGEAALAAAQNNIPDMVVLDGMMPGMDGFEVLRRLKENDDTAHIPIIMLTGRKMERDIVAGLDLGADEYITKPFMPVEFVTRVNRLLRKR